MPATPTIATRARALASRLDQHHALEISASIAFRFFLSLVPLLVIVGYVLGQFVRRSGLVAVAEAISGLAPAGAEDLFADELQRMAGRRDAASAAPLSLLGFLWVASGGVHHLMRVIEIAVGARRRPFWKQRAIALAWVVLAVATAAGTGYALLSLDALAHRGAEPSSVAYSPAPPRADESYPPEGVDWSTRVARARARHANRGRPNEPGDIAAPGSPIAPAPTIAPAMVRARPLRALHRQHAPWEQAVVAAVLLLLGVVGLAGFYRLAVEHPPGVARRAWPGAWAFVALWVPGTWAFGAYVTNLGKYSLYYGSLGAVAVTMLWLYLTSLALMVGAELNALLEGV